MANWKDRLKSASFRGVKFMVESADTTSGRRLVAHEFPGRDQVLYEDLGRSIRDFTIEAYLIGEDYDIERDLLEKALETEGPGLLIHPTKGFKNVVCKSYSTRESVKEGRIVRFSINFSEAFESEFPTEIIDPFSSLENISITLKGFSKKNLEKKYSVETQPQFVLDAAVSFVKEMSDAVLKKASKIIGKGQNLATKTQATANFFLKQQSIKNNASLLVKQVSNLADSVIEIFELAEEAADTLLDSFLFYLSFFDFGSDKSPIQEINLTRAQQNANQESFIDMVQITAISQAIKVSSQIDFGSFEEATKHRQIVLDKIDNVLERISDDTIFNEFLSASKIFSDAVPSEDQRRNRTIKFTPQKTTSSLVLAYDFYEDSSRYEDIAIRNNLSHPGFVQGGKEIDLLVSF